MQIRFLSKKNNLGTPDTTAIPRQFLVLRVMSLLFLGAACFLLASMVWFMYTHVEQSLSQADSILFLKTQLSVESIDFERYDMISHRWEEKYTTSTPNVSRNPFFDPIVEELPTTTLETTIILE